MSEERFRGVLNAASFPMVSDWQSRTVVQAGLDNNIKTNRQFYGTDESADYGIPQLFYCENVVPTGEGVQSVGYIQQIEGLAGSSAFDQAISLRDENENVTLMSPAGGLNYFYNAVSGIWESKNPLTSFTGLLVTRAYVNGRTFVCYEGAGIYEYDAVAKTFDKQTLSLSGITEADIRGIGASSNYLILFTKLTVYWSSLIDPLDFVPSLTTGAGFATPQDVKARITAVLGTSGGFIVYTARNAVAAVYTNNAKAPFNFKEIGNAGGVHTYEQVTSEQTSGPQYAWTTGGLQKITLQGAENVNAELNDFLAGQLWEEFDQATNQLIKHTEEAAEFSVKVTFISSRYLIISYATAPGSDYNYAIFYDIALKRYGKLKVDHVDCFQFPYPNIIGPLTYADLAKISYDNLSNTHYSDLNLGLASDPPSKRTIAFLGKDGSVQLLDFTYNKTSQHEGVAIFGKFQLVRARNFVHQQTEFEGLYMQADAAGPTNCEVLGIVSFNGNTPDRILPMTLNSINGRVSRWGLRAEGKNVSLLVKGTFALSTYIVRGTRGGSR